MVATCPEKWLFSLYIAAKMEGGRVRCLLQAPGGLPGGARGSSEELREPFSRFFGSKNVRNVDPKR